MSFVTFFALLVALLLAVAAYAHRRVTEIFGLRARGQWLLGAGLVLAIVALFVGRFASRGHPEWAWWAAPLSVGGSAVVLGAIISAGLFVPIDLARGIGKLVDLVRRITAPSPTEPAAEAPRARAAHETVTPAPRLGRRELVVRGALASAAAVGGGSSLYGAVLGRHDYEVETVPIRIPDLPRTLDGFTIVQLSDIHFGTYVREPELRAAVDLVRSARPDLVVLTGDLVDHDPRYAWMVGELTARLVPLAREGVAAIPGNHDYYAGVDDVLGALRRGGARVLRNDARLIGDRGGSFALLGVDDVWADAADVDRAIAQAPPDAPRVLLCHNPVYFPEAAGKVALQLSGHTHGGQVNIGVRLADYVLPYGYVAGRYDRDGSVLYVNRGFGTAGPPARVGSPPEVTRIVLTT